MRTAGTVGSRGTCPCSRGSAFAAAVRRDPSLLRPPSSFVFFVLFVVGSPPLLPANARPQTASFSELVCRRWLANLSCFPVRLFERGAVASMTFALSRFFSSFVASFVVSFVDKARDKAHDKN